MAKHKDEFDIDGFNPDDFIYDSGFDEPDQVKDDRSPAVKVGSSALKSALDSAKSPGFYGQILRKALPDSYGEAFDVVDVVASEGVGLYNEVTRELKPTVNVLKRAAKAIKPRLEPILPKKLSQKIDNLLVTEDSPGQANVDAQQASIDASLLEVFKAQAAAEDTKNAKETIEKAVDRKRAKVSLDQQSDIRSALHRMVSFQDGVQVAYLKKSLELKYRHFFAAKDLLDVTKSSTTETVQLLRNITKNTALPEFVKMRADEALKEQFRNKLMGSIQGYVSDRTAPFVREILQNLRGKVKEKVGEFASAVGSSAASLDSMDEGLKMAEEFGLSKEQMAGEIVGGGLVQEAGNWVGKKLRPHLAKQKHIGGAGHFIQRMLNDAPSAIRDWADTHTEQYGWKGNLIDFAKSLVSKEQTSFNIAESTVDDIKAVAYWTNQDSKTLQEIIPGLLSRIHQSSEGIRTGTLPDRLQFDFKSNGFQSTRERSMDIHKSIASRYNLDDIDWRTGNFLELLDPDEKLPADVRDKIRVKLMQEVSRKQSFDIKDFNHADAFRGMVDDDTAELVAKKFSELVKTDEAGKTAIDDVDSQKNYLVMSNAYRALRSRQDDAIRAANIAGNLGDRELLRKLGVTTYRDNRDVYNNNYVLDSYKNFLDNGRNYEKTIREASLGGVPNNSAAGSGRPAGPGLGGSVNSPTSPVMDAAQLKAAIKEAISQERVEPAKPEHTEHFASEYGPDDLREDKSTRKSWWRSKWDPQEGSGGFTDIVTAIKENSTKTAVESIDGKLDAILEAILNIDCSGGGGGPSKGRIRRALGKGYRGAKSLGSKYLKMIWGAQKRFIGAPFKLAKGLGKRAMGAFNTFRNWRKNRIQDVYILGFTGPKLTADKMREGHYVDAETGNPIKTISDIKGAVRDLTTGNIVLTKEEFDSGLYSRDWKKLNNAVKSWVLDKAGKLFTGAKNLALSPFRFAKRVANTAYEALFTPKDVFVPGESSPRLLGLLMLRGKYFSSKTGKPIRKVGDIDSDVKDENGIVKLTLEEFARGVVDQEGKPILTRTKKIMNLLSTAWKGAKWVGGKMLGAAKTVKDITVAGGKWFAGKAVDVGTRIGRGIGGLLGGQGLTGFGIGGGGGKYQIEQLNVLKRIHNMLRNHFGLPGDDLPLTEMPTSKLSGLGSKFAGFGRRAKARARLARMRAGKGASAMNAKTRLAARARLLRGKAKGLWAKRPKYKTWKEKLRERMAEARSGNWRDILAQRKNQVKDKVKNKFQAIKTGGGWGGKILAAILGLGGFLKTAVGKLGDLVTGFGSLRKILTTISAGGAVADALGGGVDLPGGGDGKKPAGKKGFGAKAWSALKTGGKWLGKGLLFGGGLAIRGAGMLLAGAAGVLSSPVVLTAMAVTAAATAGYYTYRYFKDKLQPLQKVRFTQYGLPTDDRDVNVQVGEMERILTNSVEWAGGKAVNIKIGQNLETILPMFGISISDGNAVKRFVGWMQNRFKPVYLTHLTLLQKYASSAKLETIDDNLPKQFKAEFAHASKYSETDPLNPYNYGQHPLQGKQLIEGVAQINIAIQEVEDEFGKFRGKSEDQVVAADQKKLDRYKYSMDPKMDKSLNRASTMGTIDTSIKDPMARSGNALLSGMKVGTNTDPANYVLDPNKDPDVKVKAITKPSSAIGNRPMPVAYGSNASEFIRSKKEGTGDATTYSSIPQVHGVGYQAVIGMLEAAADATGVHPSLLAAIASAESSFNPSAKAKSSSAAGLFQFMPKTWAPMMAKYAEKYGIPANATPMDPVASALLAGELTRENATIVEKKTGISVGPAEAYIAHFFGAGAASSFLGTSPNEIASQAFPTQASQNQPIFFNKDGSSRTVGEVYNVLANKVEKGTYGVTNSVELPLDQQPKVAPPPIPVVTRPTPDTDLASKSPAINANRETVMAQQAHREKVVKSISPINYSTFATSVPARTQDITRQIQPNNLDARVAAAKPVSQIEVKRAESLTQDAKVMSRTTQSMEERKRREREIQSSAHRDAVVDYMSTTTEILSKQLEVQIEIRDGIHELATGMVALGTALANKSPGAQYVPNAKPQNPIDLGRKGSL